MTKLKEAQKREDMLLDLYKFHAYIPNDAMGNTLTSFGNFCEGYEAAHAIDAKRIADFYRYQIKSEGVIATLENTILDLEADNNEYLKELAACRDVFEPNDEINFLCSFSDPLCVADYVKAHVQSIAKAQSELEAQNNVMREALEKLRDCDFVISLPDRIDSVRDIARISLAKVEG